MDMEAVFLRAIHESPADEANWLVLADWLEEHDDPVRAELLRLHALLRRAPEGGERLAGEQRLQELLRAGVQPCVPVLLNSIGMRLVLVPPGVFLMGAAPGEHPRHAGERPRHKVAITRPFYLGMYQVTQAEYEKVMGTNPSAFSRAGPAGRAGLETWTFPADNISYEDALAFCAALSALPAERRAGRVYRLPSEAEWEYACRAGVWSTPYHFGKELLPEWANFGGSLLRRDDPYPGRPTAVGSYPPNAWGLYDMHGNVWEWCADWYDKGYYRRSPAEDPAGPAQGQRRVLRGGGWSTSAEVCRAALRGHNLADARFDYNGFRVALSAGGAVNLDSLVRQEDNSE
jgi:uncharacterized protein (TIGR02996 family)